MRRRRLIIALVVLLALAGVTAVTWKLANWPPPRLILRYGLTPGCEPTGRTLEIEGVEFVEIGPGCFRMGSTHLAEGGDFLGKLCAAVGLPWGDQPKPSNEMPVHWVEFRRGFWIARTEVTNEQYERFDPRHDRGRSSKCDRDPIVYVSWADAKQYCAWLAERSEISVSVRLPSEAEWECACRAGSETEFTFGDDEGELSEYAWYAANSEDRANEVGTRRPNAWGIHNLHGNAWEWCEDRWHDSYDGAPGDGSAWMAGGSPSPVFRGGCWYESAERCRSAYRDRWQTSDRFDGLGFRPALILPDG